MDKRVTVIIPVLNEEKHIGKVLRRLIHQDWAGDMEIIVVDGNSADRSRDIVKELAASAPPPRTIRLLINPQRHIPISLNIACRNATNDIIIRLDGHSYPPDDYITRMLKALEDINYRGIVGGKWNITAGGEGPCARAIAFAVSHPYGIGNAAYRTIRDETQGGQTLVESDTVPFGAFSKDIWFELTGYDELLLYDEDYDFAFRARKRGYRVFLDPGVVIEYVPRSKLNYLWRQYYRYGFWVAHFFLKHKTVPNWRRIVPLLFVSSALAALVVALRIGFFLLMLHTGVSLLVSVRESLRFNLGFRNVPYLFASFLVLHWSYGIGNLLGFAGGVWKKIRLRRSPKPFPLGRMFFRS